MNKSPVLAALLAGAVLMLLTACAGSPAPPSSSEAVPLVLEETPPQSIRANACHLVLWTRAEPSRRILIAWNSPAEATVRVAGKTLTLPRTTLSGADRFGHHERQTWKSRVGEVSADVRFEALPGAADVSAIRSAAVSFTDARGETIVTPAVGMVSCGGLPQAPPPAG
jgi:hypothetical protein